MLRIGIAGTENSHTDHFIRHLNIEQNRQDARVVALAGGATERNRTLAERGQIDIIVDAPEEFAGEIDAAIICHRQGGEHRKHTVPLLEAGKHVFVDKPTATSVSDVEDMIDAARSGGAVLASWSILRTAPGIEELRSAAAGLEEPSVVTVVGPADPADPHAGLFFYGPHIVEPALEILGNPGLDSDVSVHAAEHAVTAFVRAGGVQLVLAFIRKNGNGSIPWHATVAARNGVVAREITTSTLDHGTGLDRFVDAARSGTPPMPYEQLIPPVSILADITAHL
ncbi:Gfo/Idh/MocA family oxidoreductase [Phytoactinopolyspora mesophila]|uniref:Gfo/Idh/MocA family oxidoreductase n=1 Tax=Phytoactinopolyspora mesophila TaxID=2650750 RepID=UPI001391AE79